MEELEWEDRYFHSGKKKLVYYENDEELIREIGTEFHSEFGPALKELEDLKERGSVLLAP